MKAAELIAYCAGLFDGEGCIHIARISTKKRSLTFQLVCKVSMSSLPVLELLMARYGGSIRAESQSATHNKYGLVHSWAISSSNAVMFLTQLLPYLVVKREQAELALLFQSRKLRGRVTKTEEALALEEAQYILMRSLKKGVTV